MDVIVLSYRPSIGFRSADVYIFSYFKLEKEQCLAGVSVISIIYSGLWIVCLLIG